MKRSVLFCTMILICLLAAGCEKRGERTAQLEDYERSDSQGFSAGYISGVWGDAFVRSNGETYPFVFDVPVVQCTGFTLEYQIHEVLKGNLNGNFRYEVYVRQTDGNWKSVELFQMEGYETTLEIRFDKIMDIDAVAVVCGKKHKVYFSYTIAVRDVRSA